MIRISPSIIALVVSLLWATTSIAERPTNNDVTKKVERITKDPRYYWLKGEEAKSSEVGDAKRGANRSLSKKKSKSKNQESASGCGYQPSAPKETPAGERRFESFDCDCGPNIGSCGCEGIPGGHYIGYIISAVLLLLLIASIVKLLMQRPPSFRESALGLENLIDQDANREDLAAIPASLLFARALKYAAQGSYKSAVGLCYLSSLAHLHQTEQADLHHSLTNMAILRSVESHGGEVEPLARVFSIFENLFFGKQNAIAAHWTECKNIIEVHLEVLPAEQ